MLKIFTGILSCGILPALGQYVSQASELGTPQNQNCLQCWWDHLPKTFNHYGWGMLLQILPMCTDQSFFQTFCTRMVESVLLREVQQMHWMYVFIFDFLDMINWILLVAVLIQVCHILVGKPCQRLVSVATNTEGTLQWWLHSQ